MHHDTTSHGVPVHYGTPGTSALRSSLGAWERPSELKPRLHSRLESVSALTSSPTPSYYTRGVKYTNAVRPVVRHGVCLRRNERNDLTINETTCYDKRNDLSQ